VQHAPNPKSSLKAKALFASFRCSSILAGQLTKIAKISGLAYWELCGAPLSSELLALCAITPMVCEMPQFQFKIYHSPATKVWHFPSAWCFPNQGVPVAQYR
jgi:hypothetical protein